MYVNGTVEIRDGLDSDALLLAFNGAYGQVSYYKSSLGQPVEGFSSKITKNSHGLYVRLIKPFESGNFSFAYGYYTIVEDRTVGNNSCRHQLDRDHWQDGYVCRGHGWCIPYDHTCNGAENCPGGDDEQLSECASILAKRQRIYGNGGLRITGEQALRTAILTTVTWAMYQLM